MKAPFNMSNELQRKDITTDNAKEIAIAIFHDAESYHLIAIKSMQTVFPKAMTAITVNAALACELFIKSIVTFEKQKFCKGHSLYKLFNDIQDESIKSRIIKYLGNYDFYRYLEEIDSVFPIARYIYEYQSRSCDLSFILSFANALSNECQSLLNKEA